MPTIHTELDTISGSLYSALVISSIDNILGGLQLIG